MIVPRVRTPVLLEGLVEILHAAAHTALGQCPGARDVVAYAMLVEEHGVDVTGRLLRGVYYFNLGNHDAPPEAGDRSSAVHVFSTLFEAEGSGLHVWSVQHLREAYATVEDGAAGLWLALAGRYIGAWEAAIDEQGNPAPRAFAEHLAATGYFTGSLEAYAQALERIVAGLRSST